MNELGIICIKLNEFNLSTNLIQLFEKVEKIVKL